MSDVLVHEMPAIEATATPARAGRRRSWNDVTVSFKLTVSMFALLAAMLGVAALLQFLFIRVAESGIDDVKRYDRNIVLAVQWLGTAQLWTERMVVGLNTVDADLMLHYEESVKAGMTAIRKLRGEFSNAALSGPALGHLQAIDAQQARLIRLHADATALANKGDLIGLQKLIANSFQPGIDGYIRALNTFARDQEEERDRAVDAVQEKRDRMMLAGLACAGGLFIIAGFIVLGIVRSITRPLAHAINVAECIGAGKLSQSIDTQRGDEFGRLLQALANMATSLHDVVTEVQHGIDAISSASAEIASGNQELSSRTEQTAASLEQTASSMEELTSTVRLSSEKAVSANAFAATSTVSAKNTSAIVRKAVASMEKISISSGEIANIIGVIDGLAFQTNILALNAAVEAARAGAQGRGFAVVAGEVRTLAQRSAQAAREIAALVNTSVASVHDGVRHVDEAGKAITTIVDSIHNMSVLMSEITNAAGEQNKGLDQINEAVSHLDQMTQMNMGLVQESAVASEALRHQADRLSDVIRLFDVGAADNGRTK
ncbi:methyl-accepting chemotaxis protein [Herbaspirillum sp. NPDC101397]|uniref:methyl-accepting chemotaxis protein n=1 Tax=Herbaspirillum sp. NPDC101397 TaxID=3364006 RepID=UPI00383BC5DC